MTILCTFGSVFLSTPSARRATFLTAGLRQHGVISIHALREEGDLQGPLGADRLHQISIHALREEGDRPVDVGLGPVTKFLSTPSARRATPSLYYFSCIVSNFYPRPPRGGRPNPARAGQDIHQISIHALREEGDLVTITRTPTMLNFYPRPPRGGRPARGTETLAAYLFLSTPSARRATPGPRHW